MWQIKKPWTLKRLQSSHRPSANSLTLVPAGTIEYIAAGDSQAAVPFPKEIGRDFDLQWKTASGFSYLLLQLGVTAGKRAFRRRMLRRPHPARREVTCGYTDMDWPRLGAVLHTTGLWGRSYLGVGRKAASRTWQKLCQREDTGLPWGKPYRGRIHIWENAWRSPTRLMEVSAVRSAVLRDRNFSSTESSGSKGPLWSPARTIERSQEGTRGDLEGFIHLHRGKPR